MNIYSIGNSMQGPALVSCGDWSIVCCNKINSQVVLERYFLLVPIKMVPGEHEGVVWEKPQPCEHPAVTAFSLCSAKIDGRIYLTS